MGNACCRYILVYPQGCDVANHLSLFLCVADYDKLLPGWAHFAQFTIAVSGGGGSRQRGCVYGAAAAAAARYCWS